jgi:hypothetical protein
MAGTGPRNTTPAPDDMHWGINYLREDIQDIRAEVRDLRAEMRAGFARMDDKYEQVCKRMDARFNWTLGAMVAMTGTLAALIKL